MCRRRALIPGHSSLHTPGWPELLWGPGESGYFQVWEAPGFHSLATAIISMHTSSATPCLPFYQWYLCGLDLPMSHHTLKSASMGAQRSWTCFLLQQFLMAQQDNSARCSGSCVKSLRQSLKCKKVEKKDKRKRNENRKERNWFNDLVTYIAQHCK